MRTAMRQVFCMAIFAMISIFGARAQSPAPIVLQAASPAAITATVPTATTQNSASVETAIKLLEQTKAKNEETLKKQQAALQQLDELQQAAEQLKIFSKRG
jgi:cell shape-determining protein MreC